MARVNNKCMGKKLIVPALVIILLCIGLGIILYQNSIQENGSDILLEIMATNDKNEQANSYEIWISSIYVNDVLYDVGSIALPEGWKLKDGSIFSANQNVTNNLQIQIPNVHNAKINFQKHAWAGMVEIKCGGVTQTVDLYADSTEDYEMTIFDNKIEENGDSRLSIILFVIGFVICYVMLYTFLKEKKGYNKAIAIVAFIAYTVNMYILYCTTPQIASTQVLRACLVIVSVVALFMNYAAWNNRSMDKHHTKLKILILCIISAGISLLIFGQNFISKYDLKITFSMEGALYSICGLIWIVPIIYAVVYFIMIRLKNRFYK